MSSRICAFIWGTRSDLEVWAGQQLLDSPALGALLVHLRVQPNGDAISRRCIALDTRGQNCRSPAISSVRGPGFRHAVKFGSGAAKMAQQRFSPTGRRFRALNSLDAMNCSLGRARRRKELDWSQEAPR